MGQLQRIHELLLRHWLLLFSVSLFLLLLCCSSSVIILLLVYLDPSDSSKCFKRLLPPEASRVPPCVVCVGALYDTSSLHGCSCCFL